MRVLHLTTEFPPVIYGGLGTAVGGWVGASARAGIEVAVQLVEGPLVLDQRTHGYGYGSPRRPRAREGVTRHDGVAFLQCSWANALEAGIRLVSEWRADILHLHTAMLWYLAHGIREATATPIVYHIHSVDRAEYEIGEERNPWLRHTAQELAIDQSDRLIALTEAERNLLARYYPGAHHKVRVVGNGIEDSAHSRKAAFRKPCRRDHLVLYSGRLVERKGIRELLAAIPDVLRAAPDTAFVIVGGPPPLTGPEVAAQWIDTADASLDGRVRFTGWQTPANVGRWYAASDLLVVPSRYEPFGMVILEGMLYGLAVVAADVGGPSAILSHGQTGILFPARDAKALAQALIGVILNPEQRRRIAEAGAREVRTRWLWRAIAPAMLDVYQELAGC